MRRAFLAGVTTASLILGASMSASGASPSVRQWTHSYGSRVTALKRDVASFQGLPRAAPTTQKVEACQRFGSADLHDVHVPKIPNKRAEAQWRKAIQSLYAGAIACLRLKNGQTQQTNGIDGDLTTGQQALVALAKTISLKSGAATKKRQPAKKKSATRLTLPSRNPPPLTSVPQTAVGPPAATPPTAKPSSARTTFADGTWSIGSTSSDIAPGTYRTPGGSGCFWERLGASTGQGTVSLANATTSGQAVVTVLPSDTSFESKGCGTWSPLPANGPKHTTFGDGIYAVGIDIAPGTYSTKGGNSCYWERVSDFDGSGNDVIANGLQSGPITVTIAAGDKGFVTQACGTWTSGDG